jgi:hypothetical protein
MSSVRSYLAEIGRRGGTKSRRTLDPDAARDMVRVRASGHIAPTSPSRATTSRGWPNSSGNTAIALRG